jgi:hypothetical protein
MMLLCHVVVARLYQSEVVGLDFDGKRVLPETTQPRSAVSPTAVRRHGANHHRIRELPVAVLAREAPPPSQHTRERQMLALAKGLYQRKRLLTTAWQSARTR